MATCDDRFRINGEDGIRTPQENAGKTRASDQGGAESGALGAQHGPIEPDLALLIDRWPTLPDATKAAITTLVMNANVGG